MAEETDNKMQDTQESRQARKKIKQVYNFPEYGISVTAENREEAEKILKKKLKENENG